MIVTRELQDENDLASVLKLCKDFFAEYEDYHEEFFDTHPLSDDDLSGRFRQSMASDNSVTIIAEADDRVVGYVSMDLREQPSFYKVKRVGAVWGLMVAERYRRRGIATRLLSEAKTYFRRKGIKYFTAYTSVANHGAIEFYRRNGMEPLHTTLLRVA